MSSIRRGGVALAVIALIAAGAATDSFTAPVAHLRGAAQAPDFLQPGHCYRMAFPIDGAPNYKVLEILENGWVRGEVDAGPARAQRPSMWINTAQIITARETRCSE